MSRMDASKTSIGRRVRWLYGASHMLMWGLMAAWMGGVSLLAGMPASRWLSVLGLVISLLVVIWLLPAGWISSLSPESEPGLSEEDKYAFPLLVSTGLIIWLVKLPWAVPLLGILFAIFFLNLSRIRHRAYYALAAGWCLAGLAVPRYFAWQGELQYNIFFFLGGIATMAQGAWELTCSLRLQRRQTAPE